MLLEPGLEAYEIFPACVQGAGLLPELRRPAHDRGRGPAGRRGAAAGARAPVGAEPAVPAAVRARVGSRACARGARGVRARGPSPNASPGPAYIAALAARERGLRVRTFALRVSRSRRDCGGLRAALRAIREKLDRLRLDRRGNVWHLMAYCGL